MTGHSGLVSRRGFLGASALGGTALLLTACSATGGSGGATGGSGGGGKNFSWANWSDAPATSQLYIDLITKYATDNGIQIDRQANVSFADYNTKFRTLLAGGQPPDIMRLNDDFLRELQDKDQLFDTTALIASSGMKIADYFPEVFNFGERNGKHSAMTIGLSPRVVYYNKTAFQKAGVPLPPSTWSMDGWKWDDFLNAAKALTKGTSQYGCQITLDTGNEQAWSANNGGEGIFSKDGKTFTLAEGANLEAMQWAADLSLKHKVQAPWADVQATNATYDRFANQQDMMRTGPMSDYTTMQTIAKDFEFGVAPMPGQVKQLQNGGFTLFVIPAKAKNPEAAFKFLSYLSGPEGGKQFAEKAVFVAVNREAASGLTSGLKLFGEAADNQTTTNSTTATSQAVALYRPQLQLAYGGNKTVKEALGSVADQINSLLQA
jgi:multiple sugar transport system substrate-binding protein